MKNSWNYLVLWTLVLFVAMIVSVFLHEVGHGIGATMDGVHVSTGFNKVGMPGKTPDDPDFRMGMKLTGVWGGLLGPVTTWVLAIVFTIMLYRQQKPTRTAFVIGTLAIANGLLRALPMLMFVGWGLLGQLRMEDEVGWGIWYVTKTLLPSLSNLDMTTLVSAHASILLTFPAVWIPPLVSLALSLTCLVLAYRRIFKLDTRLSPWSAHLLLIVLSIVAWFAHSPVTNVLDRVIRINW
ncbi:MAG: site-2 protease family protein [Chloroflexi bacterium]|nr:site-2 protease family protein [Chloroflexota bacterium]